MLYYSSQIIHSSKKLCEIDKLKKIKKGKWSMRKNKMFCVIC